MIDQTRIEGTASLVVAQSGQIAETVCRTGATEMRAQVKEPVHSNREPRLGRFFIMTESSRSMTPKDQPQPTVPRVVNSEDLMQGGREIVIRHGNEFYRLNVTRSGKLILRK